MRPDRIEEEEVNNDSFMDVVANVVGVLVILVMLVGAQASQKVLVAQGRTSGASRTGKPTSAEFKELEEQLENETREAISSQQGVVDLAAQVARLAIEAEANDRERVKLAMHRQVITEDLERRRGKLDTDKQEQFDVQRQLLQSQIKLDQLTQQHLALASTADDVETIECVPTPLAKVTDVPSIHLRLRQGMVSIVPVEKLRQEFQYHAEGIRRRLQSSPEVSETFGPIDGYRAKLTVVKRGPAAGPIAGQRQENVLETYVEFLPISDDIGQNIEQALLPGSAVYEYLESQRRESPPVDVWLYTDSFNEFRTLKRALWEKGFAVSIRPLRPGDTIGASPYGSKSAAQ